MVKRIKDKKRSFYWVWALNMAIVVANIVMIPPVFAAQKTPVAQTLTLKDAIFLSLRYNPDVQTEEIQRVSDKFSLRVAQNEFELQYALTGGSQVTANRSDAQSSSSWGTTFSPVVSLNGIYGTQYNLTMNNPTTQGIYNPGLTLTVLQPLLQGFGEAVTLSNLHIAEYNEILSRLNLKSTLMSTVQQVINDYYTVIEDQNNLITAKLALDAYADTVKMDNALVNAGRQAPTDVLQAEAQYASEEVTYETTLNQAEIDKLNFLNTLGLSPDLVFKLPDDVDITEEKIPEVEEAYQIALRNSPTYLQSLISVYQAEINLMVAIDSGRTQLNFTLTAATGNGAGPGPNSGLGSLTNNRNTSVSGALEFTVPIDNYVLEQGIISSKVSLQQSKISLEQTKRTLKSNIISDIANVKSNYKQVVLSQNALVLQQKNQDYLNAQLKYGLVSTFQVTTTQQDLTSARQQVITSKISYLESLAQFYLDMGILLDKWNIKVFY